VGEKPTTFTLQGVTVKELDVEEYGGKKKLQYIASYLKFLMLAFLACTRLYFKPGIDVVHVHNMPNVLVFAALIPRLFGCKLILDVHDTIPETYVAKYGKTSPLILGLCRLEERICCALAHRVIAVNHPQREALIKRGVPEKKLATVLTMPRFLPCNHSANHRAENGSFRMVNHGTIAPRLGNDLLVHATERLVREIPGFELHIIGGGDALESVVHLAKSMGLTDHVHFHQPVPWNKLPETLATMDVGIVANRSNIATELMLPLKLIDYVVLNIPAIAPRLKTIEYYFSPDLVTFFEPENVDSIVAATVALYRDKERRERQPQIARSFLEKYAWDNSKNGLKGLYGELCVNQS
jgi:glycosyltransferase involved in cell wall biosynthesis